MMVVVITLVAVAAAIVIFVVGFSTGYSAREADERKMAEQRRIGAVMEHWHGHTTHKGGTIISPARVEGGIH